MENFEVGGGVTSYRLPPFVDDSISRYLPTLLVVCWLELLCIEENLTAKFNTEQRKLIYAE